MDKYYGATICENGHVISKIDADKQRFCSACGAKTHSKCIKCNTPIRGLLELDIAIIGSRPYTRPNYCHECGAPYPWTEKILNNAVELISLDDTLDADTKELIKSAIPGLLVDTPLTPVSAAKYSKYISQASEFLKNSLHNLLVDVVTQTAKALLFD